MPPSRTIFHEKEPGNSSPPPSFSATLLEVTYAEERRFQFSGCFGRARLWCDERAMGSFLKLAVEEVVGEGFEGFAVVAKDFEGGEGFSGEAFGFGF